MLRNVAPLWNGIRPLYIHFLNHWGKQGLERCINGMDSILVPPELYNQPETYEPEVWRPFMQEVQPGDVVADVGANIGLYSVALAKRVGERGRVHAFEPDPQNLQLLQRLIDLNRVNSNITVVPCAVGDRDGTISFTGGRQSESHVELASSETGQQVQCVTLNMLFAQTQLNLLKIDVEGFEEHVLRGACDLLRDPERAPRTIFIEVHPFAWNEFGISSDSLLKLLHDCNYQVFDLKGRPLDYIEEYGEVVARREHKN